MSHPAPPNHHAVPAAALSLPLVTLHLPLPEDCGVAWGRGAPQGPASWSPSFSNPLTCSKECWWPVLQQRRHRFASHQIRSPRMGRTTSCTQLPAFSFTHTQTYSHTLTLEGGNSAAGASHTTCCPQQRDSAYAREWAQVHRLRASKRCGVAGCARARCRASEQRRVVAASRGRRRPSGNRGAAC